MLFHCKKVREGQNKDFYSRHCLIDNSKIFSCLYRNIKQKKACEDNLQKYIPGTQVLII